MPQPVTDSDRAVYLYAGSTPVRMHAPAPSESWQRQDLWKRLSELADAHGAAASIEYDEGTSGATKVTVYAVTNGLGLRWELRPDDWNGDPQAEASIEIHARDGQPVGQALLAQLGAGRIKKALDAALSDPAAVSALGERWGAQIARRPGRRGRPDLFYAIAALDYVRAMATDERTPIRVMVDAAEQRGEHVTEDELRARLRRARSKERGLLTAPTRNGVAGGELTDKALRLLREAGLTDNPGDGNGEH